MDIRVFGATASAPTPLAAFDRALQVGGVHDTNLIPLSSVVPVGARVVSGVADRGEFVVGDRLYCVLAEQRCVEPGGEAWAGIGWTLMPDERGGLFVEAHGHSRHQVEYDLATTMATMVADRPYMDLGELTTEIVGIACDSEPVCAMVLAIYGSTGWNLDSPPDR